MIKIVDIDVFLTRHSGLKNGKFIMKFGNDLGLLPVVGRLYLFKVKEQTSKRVLSIPFFGVANEAHANTLIYEYINLIND